MTPIPCVNFLVSGTAALLFETLWFRQAGLALGNTVWASALVTASFMAGLAIGNGIAVRWRAESRARSPSTLARRRSCLASGRPTGRPGRGWRAGWSCPTPSARLTERLCPYSPEAGTRRAILRVRERCVTAFRTQVHGRETP
jgi:hypothetical protein